MQGISSTFESYEPLLRELLHDVDRGIVQLPDFQRPWVWDDVHIRALLASVSLAYPIGAIMLLQTGGDEIRFRPRLVHGSRPSPVPNPEKLILDGQQRLTSLYGALWSRQAVETRDEKQKALRRYYYFHIESCLDPAADRYDAVRSVPEQKMVTSDFGKRIDLDVRTQTLEFEQGLVPASALLEPTAFAQWRMGFMVHHAYDPAKIQLVMRFEAETWMRFQQFKVPVILLLKGTPKEAVCQVFEKVNTGGVALTVFELLTATFAADDFVLRDDWEARRQRLHEHSVLTGIEGTEFLQTVTLLASYRRHLANGSKTPVSVKRRDVLQLTIAEYRENAAQVEEGLVRAARLLARECVLEERNLPYGTQLVPLGAACAFLGGRFEEENIRRKLVRWYWCGVFGQMYGGASETRFAMDIVDLCGWILNGGDEPRTVRDAGFAPNRLLSLQTRLSAAYKGAFALMVQRGSLDFMNGDPIAHTSGFSLPVDIHHIFPAAWSEKQGLDKELWNSVVNKAPLTARTNQALRGDAPSKYLVRVQQQGAVDEARLDEILATHFIHAPLLRADSFVDFIRDRAKRLLDAIEAAMGRPIQGRDAADVVAAFRGALTWTADERAAAQPKVVLFDHFEVLREVGGGGMSTVVHARDTLTGREVCLKRVRLSGRDNDALLREMQIYDRLARRAFPHAVEVLSVERDEHSIALVTAWADGGSLSEHVVAQVGGRLSAAETKAITQGLLTAVGQLHALDVIHRDIKPANVLRDAGTWKLADFGLAKNVEHAVTRVTMQQAYSPGFAPPEQVEGAPADASADVYALGKVICFMLTGETDPDLIQFPGWRAVVRSCTRPTPSDRPSLPALQSQVEDLPG